MNVLEYGVSRGLNFQEGLPNAHDLVEGPFYLGLKRAYIFMYYISSRSEKFLDC